MNGRPIPAFWIWILISVCYVLGLWETAVPLTGDQKVYVSVALEMRERASWIVPYLFGEPNFLKPPFQYWATLVGWKVFGLSMLGAVLPSVLALMGVVALIRNWNSEQQTLSGLWMAGVLGSMTYGTTAQMEIWVVLFYLAAWWSWSRSYALLTWTLVGMLSWIKGPLYPALWVFGWGLWHALHRKIPGRGQFVGLAWAVTLGLSWYGAAALEAGDAMKSQFFEQENFGKLSTSQGTPWGLWGSFLMSLMPGLPLLVLSFTTPVTQRWMRQNSVLLLSYALIPALFFTFFPYRVGTYLFLLTPVAAWIAGQMPSQIETWTRWTWRWFWMFQGVMVVSGILFSVALLRLWQGQWLGVELVLPWVGVTAFWVLSWCLKHWQYFAVACLLWVSLLRGAAIQLGERDLAQLRYSVASAEKIFYWIEDRDIWHEFGWVSASLGRSVERLFLKPDLNQFQKQNSLLILSDEQYQQLKTDGTTCQVWPRLKRRMKFPMKELILKGLSAEDPAVLRNYWLCR